MIKKILRKNDAILRYFQFLKCLIVGFSIKPLSDSDYVDDVDVLMIRRKENPERNEIPKKVWMYWEDKNIPNYIKGIMEFNKKNNPEYDFILLDKDTYKNFLPDVEFKDNMPIANKTDIIRLELLYRFGGIWIDATFILGESLNWVNQVENSQYFDIIGYYSGKGTNDKDYPIIESNFMASPRGSAFINNWLVEFKPCAELGAKAFFDKIRIREDYDSLKQGILNPPYLLVYLAGQISYRKNPQFNAYLRKTEESALFLQEKFDDNYKMNYVICRFDNPLPKMRAIKLCSGDRMFLHLFSAFGLIKKDSLIGFFSQKKNK